ncbi:MAG: valine--tRNA ligase [Clostridia bacterium]|nr:valine--tRNA ligase [Clostridia bacterium]
MSKELGKVYNPKEVESRLYKNWEEKGFFKAEVNKNKKPFTIVMPPPNITGKLHMGHALDNTMQDTIIRYKRMQGYSALWVPGTDHSAIATEAKITEKMREEGASKEKLGREEFLKRAWKWKEEYGGNIVKQLRKLGSSCDWSRERFTMDEGCSKAVREFFVRLYNEGLIYRGERIINWCPKCKTSISDSEVDFAEMDGHFWHIKYKLADSDESIIVATTRPETMFGDVAVAVNPNDDRYKHLIGKRVIVPVVNREVPIITDSYVDIELGTGALKITPAHDPNDFEVGLRHGLSIINVMDESGVMNEKADFCSGLDRYEARKLLVKRLEEENKLHKTEEIKHSVGKCYRCSTVVEPRISTQWFVKMDQLAGPAIECVKSSETKFIPDRFSKIYYHWMENIKDWCISRQLWWGHRIPVWYCRDCGRMTVSKDTNVTECLHCSSKNIYQDEDTLDTWFSSGLWPFSVLGWPEKTPELEYFYPTNVLVTGYDIIFFWVAKMIFSSLKMIGKKPFENILIHGLVRDSKGRKMSKSLGNGVDPLEVIEKYGADALRFSLMLGNSPGNDMRYFDEKVEASRNFANKIWNAARFIHMNIDGKNIKSEIPKDLDMIDKWIISRFNFTAKEVISNLDKFELGIAAQKLYDFIWDEFCDWYIEFSKILGKKEVLIWVMTNLLKLLHPFMPFVTEEIWLSFPHEKESIMISDFPKFDDSLVFEEDENNTKILMSIIKSVRNIRREMNVPHGKKTVIFIETDSENLDTILKKHESIICKLAYGKEIKINESLPGSKFVAAVNEYVKINIPVDELVDAEAELKRLKKELEVSKKQLEQTENRLKNPNFVSKAPKEVINGAKDMAEKLQNKIVGIESAILNLK